MDSTLLLSEIDEDMLLLVERTNRRSANMDLQRQELRPLRQQFVNDIKLLTRKAALQKLCAKSSNRDSVGFAAGEKLEVLSECSTSSIRDRSQLSSQYSFTPRSPTASNCSTTPRRSQIHSTSLSAPSTHQSLLAPTRMNAQLSPRDSSQAINSPRSRRTMVTSIEPCPSISPSSTITSDESSSLSSLDSPLENIIFAATQRLDSQRAEPPTPRLTKQKPLLKIKSSITRLRNHYLISTGAGPPQ